MSSRHWIIAIAFGLTASLAQAQQQAETGPNGVDERQQEAEADPFSIPVRIIEDDEAAEASERRERESAQREKDDLVAQQRMADATEAMNKATQSMKNAAWWSFGAVAVGTALLIWTLMLTRQANLAAASASREAAKTNRIMLDQTRPWLDFELVDAASAQKMKTNANRAQIDGQVRVINHGDTPALYVRARVAVIHTNVGVSQETEHEKFFAKEAGRDPHIHNAIFPNQFKDVSIGWNVKISENIDATEASLVATTWIFVGICYGTADGRGFYSAKSFRTIKDLSDSPAAIVEHFDCIPTYK